MTDDPRETTLFDEEDRAKEERVKRLVPLAKDVVMVLVKTIKATKMYLPNNPVYQKFREELKAKFDLYFQDEELLSFLVKRFDLTFLDQEVYHNPDKEDNIALMFFKDGIREFCFHRGITPEEINGFIDILKFDVKGRELDDDLVTLLWEKDFQYITYTVADEATEEEASEEEALLSFDEEPEAIRQLEELRSRAGGGRDAEAGGQEAGGAGISGAAPQFVGVPSTAPSEDYEAIRGSYQAPDDVTLLTELTDIFYEILITEKDREQFETVAESLSKALEIFVSRGDLVLATILVMKVQELAAKPELTDWSGKLHEITAKACSEELVRQVGEFMSQGEQDAMEAAGSYLRQLDERAIPGLVGLLETLDTMKSRKAVAEIIAEKCNGKGAALVGYLGHRYWYVARNIAMVLGRVADPETVLPLGAALGHTDSRVRREVIYALAAIRAERSDELISRALGDTDRQIRVIAGRTLTEHAPERAYEAILAAVKAKEFDSREFEEKKDFYELLGRAGGDKAVGFLSEAFRKKGLFKSGKRDAVRACAAYGLAAAGGPEALDLLKSEIDSKSKALRTACLAGLRRMGKSGGS